MRERECPSKHPEKSEDDHPPPTRLKRQEEEAEEVISSDRPFLRGKTGPALFPAKQKTAPSEQGGVKAAPPEEEADDAALGPLAPVTPP